MGSGEGREVFAVARIQTGFLLFAFVSAAASCGGQGGPVQVTAGVGRTDITPAFEPYSDENDNHRWDPGEPFEDLDGDGQLDSVWLGGFGTRQPTGVHDPLEARTVVVSLDGAAFSLTALDALGVSQARIRAIQQRALERIDPALGLVPERMIVASTHTHAGPDTIGVFGPDALAPGWDGPYLDALVAAAADSIVAAAAGLEPVEVVVESVEAGQGFVRDLDPPEITDPSVGILQLRRPDGSALATCFSIANHPETTWTDNLEVSADYPAVVRAALEAEFGGVGIYFSGALGLMQSPEEVAEEGFARMERLGQMYAERIAGALAAAAPRDPRDLRPAFGYTGIRVALQNFELYVAITEGIAEGYEGSLVDDPDRDCGLACFDLPAGAVRLGDALTLVAIPGELTPELVVGGITAPPGYAGPYPDAPAEPHLGAALQTDERFVIGLAFAEVGYLYPKRTYWPDESYSQRHGPGPDVAMEFMTGLVELLEGLGR